MKSILILLLLLLAGCTVPTGQVIDSEDAPLKIGVVNALSGKFAGHGVPSMQAIELAVADLRAQGHDIELYVEDGACDSQLAVSAAKRLIEIKEVDALITGCSSETLAIAPLAEESETILIAMLASSPDVSTAGDYVFRTIAPNAPGTKLLADLAHSNNHVNVAIVYEQLAYPEGLSKTFETYFKGAVTSVDGISVDETDYRSVFSTLGDIDAVVLFAQSQITGEAMLRQLIELDISVPLYTNEVFLGDSFDSLHTYNDVYAVTPNFNESSEKTKTFLRDFYETYPDAEPPQNLYLATAYDAVTLLAESFENCDDSVCAKEYLYGVQDWEGTMGAISFDERGDPLYEYVVVER
jgi:branched-chain amino acid transport system substrate-binding protein